jgi:putative FmdB family regulatory protein
VATICAQYSQIIYLIFKGVPMPTYEYQCFSCNHTFEAVQKISEDALDTCPKCSAKEVKRLLSASAFHLKGSGWYKTDYASSSSSASSKSSEPSNESSSANGSNSNGASSSCGSGCGCGPTKAGSSSDGSSATTTKIAETPVKTEASKSDSH